MDRVHGLRERSSSGPSNLPSLLRRTAGLEFDKSSKKSCFFRREIRANASIRVQEWERMLGGKTVDEYVDIN
jgi:hypothetical protein